MRSSNITHLRRQPKLRSADLPRVYRFLRRAFGPQRWWPGETPFEVMVGAILTQNTAWINVEKAIRNLKLAKKLSPREIRRMSRRTLARMLRPAGYFNVKADRLKHFVDFLMRDFRGSISRMKREEAAGLRKKLLQVNGVGPETADSILLYALGKSSFVIDAYTKRIFSRHGLADHDLDYDGWQAIFVKALPRRVSLYNDYHAQIVRVAKEHCRKAPRCGSCPLHGFRVRTKKNKILY